MRWRLCREVRLVWASKVSVKGIRDLTAYVTRPYRTSLFLLEQMLHSQERCSTRNREEDPIPLGR